MGGLGSCCKCKDKRRPKRVLTYAIWDNNRQIIGPIGLLNQCLCRRRRAKSWNGTPKKRRAKQGKRNNCANNNKRSYQQQPASTLSRAALRHSRACCNRSWCWCRGG